MTMTPLVVMTTTVAVWLLLPAAGDVSVDRTRNESSSYDVITGAPPRNTSARQLNYYRVSRILFVHGLLFPARVDTGSGDIGVARNLC